MASALISGFTRGKLKPTRISGHAPRSYTDLGRPFRERAGEHRFGEAPTEEASPVPRSNFGQKVIFWAFYRQSSNFAALAQLVRARARAGDRKGHITG